MAEPAFQDYDENLPEDEFAPERPHFGVIEGGGETTERKKGHLHAVDDDAEESELDKLHKAIDKDPTAKKKLQDKGANSELDSIKRRYVDDKDQKTMFSGGQEETPKKGIRGWSRRKKAAVGAAGAGGVFGFMLMFTLGSAPFQIIHLAQILRSNESNNEQTAGTRLRQLYTYARTGDVGQTRLSRRGNRSILKTKESLAANGIDIRSSRVWGQFDDVIIDTTKFPATQGVTDLAEARSKIADFYGVDESALGNLGDVNSGEGFKIRIADRSNEFQRKLIKESLGSLDNGTITTAMKGRYLKEYLNVPNLLHPLQFVERNVQNWLARRIDLKLKDKARQANRAPPETPETLAAKDHVRESVNGFRRAAAGILTVTGVACTIRNSATDIVELNRSRIVLPAVIEAVHIISLGAQIAYGKQDLDWNEINSTAEGFTDDQGKSIWEGKALEATAGTKSPKGEDITNENKQAFAGESTVSNIQSTVDFPGIAAACSPGGQLAQAVASVLLIVGTGGEGATASTFTKVVIARSVQLGFATVRSVITSIITDLILNRLEEFLADQPFFELPPTGPLGGNIYAYGARELSNITARLSGGIALSAAETLSIDRQQIENQKRDFQTRSFAQRMFDLKDYRSLASISMRNFSGNPVQKASRNVASFGLFRGLFSNLSTIFIPQSSAAEESTYAWFSPRYGIPKAVLDDPEFSDPYAVADKVAEVLDKEVAGETSTNYRDRAKKCFGVELIKGSEGWDVTGDKDINPGKLEYTDSNCGEDSKDWHRIMLFINDSQDMSTVACWDSTDDSACTQLGFSEQSAGSNDLIDGVTCPDNIEPHPTQEGYYKMPDAPNGEYVIYSTEARRYGSKQLVCVLYTVAMAYAKLYGPGKSVMYIGDLNASGHKSHFKGVAVDVDAGCEQPGCKAAADHTGAAKGTYDSQATKDLGHLFMDTGVIKNIWWCPNDDSLDDIINYAKNVVGKALTGSKCIEGHENHFHIDIDDKYVIPGSFTP